jgi:hypothetical protein
MSPPLAAAAALSGQGSPPRCIELSLGKRVTLQPGSERSLSIALRQPLAAGRKYNLSRHAAFFAAVQDRIAMTLELIDGSSVQVDLKNESAAPMTVEADQLVVRMEERRRPVNMRSKKPQLSPPPPVSTLSYKVSGNGRAVGVVNLEGRISPKQERANGTGGDNGGSAATLKYDIRYNCRFFINLCLFLYRNAKFHHCLNALLNGMKHTVFNFTLFHDCTALYFSKSKIKYRY